MSSYDFLALSANDFEELVCDVLNAELHLQLRTFPEGRDQGIDLRQVTDDGQTIVGQCKHYARTGRAKFLSVVKDETSKLGYRTASRYLFATTHPISPGTELEVAKILKIPPADVWGPKAINDALRRHPEIVKTHFKLWLTSTAQLERIFQAGLWNRTDALIEDIADEARWWANTPAYFDADCVLRDEGVCIITGLPGTGKTFLADRLLLDAVSDGWQATKITRARDGWDIWSRDTKQIFYFDDFLGPARLKVSAVDEAPDLWSLMSQVRRQRDHKRLIMTSREEVIAEASQAGSDRLEDVALDPARCSITLHDFDVSTRLKILSTHLFFSELPDEDRERISADRRLVSLAQNPSFNPRVIQKVVQHSRKQTTTDLLLQEIEETFENPQKLWRKSFASLDSSAQEQVLTLGTLPPRPIPLAELRTLSGFTGTAWAWLQTLKSLEPTWIKLHRTEHEQTAVFSNPSCRDYLLGLIDDPELAEERLGRIQRIDQLLVLSTTSGLITADPQRQPPTKRVYLARALLSRRDYFASCVASWTDDIIENVQKRVLQLQALRDAAMLLTIFGTAETNTWIYSRTSSLVATVDSPTGLPPTEAFSLARQVSNLATDDAEERSTLVSKLVVGGMLGATSSRDLAAYEDLPEDLRVKDVHMAACQHATRIIDAELELLIRTNDDSNELVQAGEELQARSRWYSHEIYLGDLYDRAAELRVEEP